MTEINFPDNPSINQTFTVGERTWKWTGTTWDVVVTTVVTGPQGPPGAAGAPGVGVPAGGTTGQVIIKQSITNYDTSWGNVPPSSYTHVQSAVSLNWEINHNLGYYPNVVVEDSAMPPNTIEAEIRYTSLNQVIVTLSIPISGKAYLS